MQQAAPAGRVQRWGRPVPVPLEPVTVLTVVVAVEGCGAVVAVPADTT